MDEVSGAPAEVAQPSVPLAPQRVLIVDDHALFRHGLALLLRELDAGVEVLHAGTLAAAEAMLGAERRPDLILSDVSMPDARDLRAITTLCGLAKDAPVIVVSATEDPEFIHRCIEEGASGYIRKAEGHEAFAGALACVLEGRTYLPAIAIASGRARPRAISELPALTPRQEEVLSLVQKGCTNKEIAQLLDIQAETVKKHVQGVLQRWQVHNRTEAVYVMARLQGSGRGQ